MNNQQNNNLISLKQAAQHLGLSVRGLYRLMARQEIPPPLKVGGASRLLSSDIDAYVEHLKAKRNKLLKK